MSSGGCAVMGGLIQQRPDNSNSTVETAKKGKHIAIVKTAETAKNIHNR